LSEFVNKNRLINEVLNQLGGAIAKPLKPIKEMPIETIEPINKLPIETGNPIQKLKRKKLPIETGEPSIKRSRKDCSKRDSTLKGTHVNLISDITDYETNKILVPECLMDQVDHEIRRMGKAKIQFGIQVKFVKDDGESKAWWFSNRAVEFGPEFYANGITMLQEKIETYTGLSSGWRLEQVLDVTMTLTKITDLLYVSGSRYIKTPQRLVAGKSVINVKNDDEYCFLYSILAVENYENIERNHQRTSNYDLKDLDFDPAWFPMKVSDIHKFETRNPQYSINVLTYDPKPEEETQDEIVKNTHFNLIRRSKNDTKQIHLLLLENSDTFHYLGVTNLDKLLNTHLGPVRIRSRWCHTCLRGFRKAKAYDTHLGLCKKNVQTSTLYSMPKNKYISFTDYSKTIKQQFVVYADFESVLPPDDTHFQKHEPVAAGMLLLKPGAEPEYRHFIGADCVIKFLEALQDIAENTVAPWYERHSHVPIRSLTDAQQFAFRNNRTCYLCKKPGVRLVRDHDHFTGEFMGSACLECNLSRKVKPSLPVVFHNLRGYDLHHILKYAISEQQFKKWGLSVIPQSSEKFLTLSAYINGVKNMPIKFLDSYQFLIDSLDKLTKSLSNLPITEKVFSAGLIQGKGLFPYDVATSLDTLRTITSLPPKWSDAIKDEDYTKALNVWSKFNCQTLLDYMLVYLKLDVYLLADIFEAFRQRSMNEDGLEPLTFISVPGMSWASALKRLDNPIELIQDPELYWFFHGGIRGGMTFINKHFVLSDESTQLFYIDINNLYGWALSQKLPCGQFRWVTSESEIDYVMEQCRYGGGLDSDVGYMLEVDMVIPEHIQDKLDQLPVAPESKCPPGTKVKKLLLTHEPKVNYVIHARLLQLYLELGVEVTKVHRVVTFKQAPIFANYINYNTEMRAASNCEFVRNFYKLKSNSLYGKTVENLMKRLNLRLCNTAKKLVTYASKAQFRRSTKIANDLVSVVLGKEEIELDRPSYIGQVVLDLSKLRMYKLQYKELQVYREKFNCEINIVAGDTDSFFLECKNVDLRSQLMPQMIADGLLDTSNFVDISDPLHNRNLDSVIGKFKDESKGLGYLEWIFLRPKCYSLLSVRDSKQKAKGVNLRGTSISHDTYRKVYKNRTEEKIKQQRIGSINHQLYTMRFEKRALQCFDDKRHWTGPNSSVAYGHYSIK